MAHIYINLADQYSPGRDITDLSTRPYSICEEAVRRHNIHGAIRQDVT